MESRLEPNNAQGRGQKEFVTLAVRLPPDLVSTLQQQNSTRSFSGAVRQALVNSLDQRYRRLPIKPAPAMWDRKIISVEKELLERIKIISGLKGAKMVDVVYTLLEREAERLAKAA